MRNILYIDAMNDCECSLVSRVNDGSNLLVLNIHVDVSKNPQLEINSKNIPLSVTDCVYVVPPALYVGSDSLQFRIIDNDHIGNYFSIIKVQSIMVIYILLKNQILNMSSELQKTILSVLKLEMSRHYRQVKNLV